MLLGLLGIIWIMCYNAELQLPGRHVMNIYDRIQGRNITTKSIELATNILQNVTDAN